MLEKHIIRIQCIGRYYKILSYNIIVMRRWQLYLLTVGRKYTRNVYIIFHQRFKKKEFSHIK